MIGASPQVPDLARAYYERAPEQTIAALADCMAALTARGLLRTGDPQSAAAHFAFLVIGRALDKSLFCGDRPFSARELNAQADAGVTAFLAAYGQPTARLRRIHLSPLAARWPSLGLSSRYPARRRRPWPSDTNSAPSRATA